ncbi:MAG: hypothetical protein AB8H47_04545 [Bacteroidia bacterium]
MKYLLTTILLITVSSAHSQGIQFGFKGNLGLSFVNNQLISQDQSTYSTPPQLSYGAEFPVYLQLSSAIWLRSGIGIQNKSFRLALNSLSDPDIPVQGLINIRIGAFALQLPLIACLNPKANENIMIEAGMLFSRHSPISQTISGSSPSDINQTVSGIEINSGAPNFDVTYTPELYAAFSYFLPSDNGIRQQLQVSFEYGLRQASRFDFEGEVLRPNGNIPFAGSLQASFSTLKFSYTIFPFWKSTKKTTR